MFGEMSFLTWLEMAALIAVGLGAGYFLALQMSDKRTRRLQQELEVARAELTDYRGKVNQHFLKTSLLFTRLTDNYREVYEHLASGAQSLCSDKPAAPHLDLPKKKILPAAEPSAAEDSGSELNSGDTSHQAEMRQAEQPQQKLREEEAFAEEDIYMGAEGAPAPTEDVTAQPTQTTEQESERPNPQISIH